MKTIIHLALLCMAMLMSQSCGGASHKNSDSETDNDATEESLEKASGIRFKTIPALWYVNSNESSYKWKFIYPTYVNGALSYSIIVCDDSGTPIMYDDEMGETYDSYAFAFFCAKEVATYYYRYSVDGTNLTNWCYNSPTDALINTWERFYAPEIDPYLTLCLDLPVTDDMCPPQTQEWFPQIQEWFNKAYYDYKDKDMYLSNSGYGFRYYKIGDSNLRIHRYGNENFPEYHGALAIDDVLTKK